MKLRLKEIRKARGYKNAKSFSDFVGLQEKTYRNYEQEARTLTIPMACFLCDALGCTLDELAGREKRPPDETELLEIYRNSNPEGQKQLLIYARGIAQSYPKSNQIQAAS